MRRRGKIVAAMVVAAILLLGAVCYGLLSGWGPRPVGVAGPPSPLPTLRNDAAGSGCFGHDDGWDADSTLGLFWVGVDRDPQSVTAVWWPTANDPDCRVVSTDGTRQTADTLATAIRTAPALLRGRVNCPADFGGLVDLYFAYSGGRWERIRVHPTGCPMLTARWRKPRQALLDDGLAAIAPPGEWSQLLR